MLPEVALLDIFDFYMDEAWREVWHTLVHVCQKWRNVVFGSPRRLDLRLYCTARTPVRETLDVWPLLPIVIRGNGHEIWGMENIIAALEHNDRICELDIFDIPSLQMEEVLAATLRPFHILTSLQLGFECQSALVDSNSFLGGSAPRLRSLSLDYISFPGLPKLLLSATHLVHLKLRKIPDSGYILPEALVSCLSVLTNLERLNIGFKSPRCFPDRGGRRPPPRRRILLPVLTELFFEGVSEYLDDFLARVDAPLLDKLDITFFHQLIFDAPQITQFISRAPNLNACNEAHVEFSDWGVYITFPQIFEGFIWMFHAESQIGSFRLWRRSAPRLSLRLSFSQWNASTSSRLDFHNWTGKTTSRTANGWSFYICLPLRRVSTYPGNSRRVSRHPCKNSLGKEWWKCCLRCALFTLRGHSHRDPSRKPLDSSLLLDSLSVTLLLFLAGEERSLKFEYC